MVSGLPGAVQVHRPSGSELLAREIDRANADGEKQWNAHDYSKAADSYARARSAAHRAGDLDKEARAWFSICSCQYTVKAYSYAIHTCESGYRLGLQAGNKSWAGGSAGNLAGIYRNLGEYSLAEREGREALRLLENSPRKNFLVNALIYLTDLYVEQGRFREGIAFSDRGIRIARESGQFNSEALLWDVRGFALLKANRLNDAADAFHQAQAIRVNGQDNAWLSVILGHRSELELKRSNYIEALRLNDQAIGSQTSESSSVPAYYFVHIRGEILRALNREPEALEQFRKAMKSANSWREAAVPGDSTNTQTVVYLNEVYADFAQLAASMSLERHDQNLSREAFEALAQNRGASLREQLAASLVRDPQFSDQYFALLSKLQQAQARVTLGDDSAQDASNLQAIRLELSELEDQSLSFSKKKEKYEAQNSLKDIQARLDQTEVLLSFCLGKTTSFLWAVTMDSIQLFKLPSESEIELLASGFEEAVKKDRREDAAGHSLSNALFGQLSPRIWNDRNWLITEDGALAGLIPYAALTDLNRAQTRETLVAHHSLRILPSELLLLLPKAPKTRPRFVGVADPIYNRADPRRIRNIHLVSTGNTRPYAGLGRLAGSNLEVRAAAALSGLPQNEILQGAEANGSALREALKEPPEVVHFAVHVVSPEGKPQEAALALSLTSDNMPELLTREAVAAYHVPGSLVVLSGCASGQGKALPSAGLIGLSRAWLLAGASAVVVSSWPIPDDSGEFFSAFYRHLQTTVAGSLAQRAATALQQTQADMQRSSGYRAARSFWAAYSILSKE